MATIPTLQIPQMGAVSGGADFAPLAQLPQIYQKYQQDQANKQALAAFQQTGDPRALIGSGDMNLAQLGINAQNHLDTLRQQGIENKRADINVGLAQGQGRRADAAEARAADEFKNIPYQFRENPDGTITDLYAEAAARAANANPKMPAGWEANPDFGKTPDAPKWRPITGGPEDPTTIANQAEAKQGAGMGDGAVEIAARRLKGGDLSALTNVGKGMQGAKDLGRIQGKMADILIREDGLSPADAAKQVSEAVKAFKADTTYQNTEARTSASREANLNLILKATQAAVPAALELSDQVSRVGWVPLDKIIQKGKVMTNDPLLARFAVANLQLAEHWARAMNPTGVMRGEDRDIALSHLNTARDKETYKAVVDQIQTQIGRERDVAASSRGGGAGAPDKPAGATAKDNLKAKYGLD